jgi:hypothetical protein
MALTLTITDLGNGSGLYDVTGSTGTTLVYHAPSGDTSWSLHDTVTEDTNGEIDAEPGFAWWYAIDDAGIPTVPISATITNSDTTSLVEAIAQVIQTRIAAITTGNGYLISVTDCKRPNRKGQVSQENYQVWLEQGTATRNQEKSIVIGTPPATAYDQEFILTGFINQSNSDLTATDTLINEFASQVRKGICTPEAWETWSGLAVDTVISDIDSTNQQDGGPSQFVLNLTVTYRTKDNDPYTQV